MTEINRYHTSAQKTPKSYIDAIAFLPRLNIPQNLSSSIINAQNNSRNDKAKKVPFAAIHHCIFPSATYPCNPVAFTPKLTAEDIKVETVRAIIRG